MINLTSFFSAALITFFVSGAAYAAQPTPALEQKIAYQQGQFGALYDRCGSSKDKMVIGGSAQNWQAEIFAGYKGTAAEKQNLEKMFGQAQDDVKADKMACDQWIEQAAATWRAIQRLTQYGSPVVYKK